MIHVHKILGPKFPIAWHDDFEFMRQAGILGLKKGGEFANPVLVETVGEALAVIIQIDEDIAAPIVDLGARQAARADVEILQFRGEGRVQQLALQIIDPGMIAAGKFGQIAPPGGDFDAPMAADIAKGVHLAGIVAA